MAAERLGGLREIELERLADGEEAVEERARQPDVVVDDDGPVGRGRDGRLQHPVQVLELPAGELLGDRPLAQSRIRRAHRAERDSARCGDSD